VFQEPRKGILGVLTPCPPGHHKRVGGLRVPGFWGGWLPPRELTVTCPDHKGLNLRMYEHRDHKLLLRREVPENVGSSVSGTPKGILECCCGAGTDTLRRMFLSSLRGTENVGSSVLGTPKGILGCCCGAGTDTLRRMFLSSLRGTENVGSSASGTPKGIPEC
jgi:hypothetical protein